jgi:hypothetical protein
MRILVVDDSLRHLEAARQSLADHELTLVDSYTAAQILLQKGAPFDAVLSDLMMPAEPQTLGPEGLKFLGHQIPIGFVVALLAARVGVKRIAVVTDANHHNHPMSAALDWIGSAYWDGKERPTFKVNGAAVLIAHAKLLPDGGKDWAAALEAVTDDPAGVGG